MALTQTAAPQVEPVSPQEAKNHLRVTSADEDTYIDALIAAARQFAETFTRRALITQTWEWRLDAFYPWTLCVPHAPLQSVTSIQYVDGQGQTQTLATSEYLVDSKSQPGRITPAYGKAWPATRPQMSAVTITFKAGYGDAGDTVPIQIRQAILLILGEYYARREHAIAGTIITEVPFSARSLLLPFVLHTFG